MACTAFRFALLSTLLAAVLAATAWADPEARFREVPGAQMFSGRLIVKPRSLEDHLGDGLTKAQARARRSAATDRLAPLLVKRYAEVDETIVRVPPGRTENDLAAELLRTGDYQYVEPDWLVSAVVIPNDPMYPGQWHLPQIGAPIAWTLTTGDPGVIIAVCDSGVDLDHPDLVDRLVSGYNAVDQLPQSEGGQVDGLTDHGTQVAGSAAAAGNNAIGVSGVGWNLRIMPIRVSNLPNNLAQISDLNAGGRWAVDHGAKIVNTSFSGAHAQTVETTGAYIRAHGGISVWAAGNANVSLNFDHPSVLIIGATNQLDQKASFSNFGPAIDLAAPGVDILMPKLGGQYGTANGTSFAAPITAGLLGLIWSANASLTPLNVEAIAQQTALDLGAPGDDDVFGQGRIDAAAAVALASDALTIPLPPIPAGDFGSSFDQAPATIDVLVNDTDLNGDDLHIASFDAVSPSGAMIELVPGRDPREHDQLRYTPTPDFTGLESFSYVVEDETGLTATESVTIAVGHAPPISSPTILPLTSGAFTHRMLARGDFDGDGRGDLVTAQPIAFNPVAFVRNQGGGLLVPQPPLSLSDASFAPDAIATGDVNGDGLDDLIMINRFGNRVAWAFSNGDFTISPLHSFSFTTPNMLLTRTSAGEPLDFNGDGRLDFVIASLIGSGVTIAINNGHPLIGFTLIPLPPGAAVLQDVAAADFDGDTDVDLALMSNLGSLTMLWNNGSAAFTASPLLHLSFGTRQMIGSDYDGDGDNDLIVTGTSAGTGFGTPGLWAIRNNGSQSIGPLRLFLSPLGDSSDFATTGLHAADFDLDDNPEFTAEFFFGPFNYRLESVLNAGRGVMLPVPVITSIANTTGHDLELMDVENDGDMDVITLTSSFIGAALEVRLNAAAAAPPIGDLNGDMLVNGIDLGILLSQWLGSGSADLNDDGEINGVDLGILLAGWTG